VACSEYLFDKANSLDVTSTIAVFVGAHTTVLHLSLRRTRRRVATVFVLRGPHMSFTLFLWLLSLVSRQLKIAASCEEFNFDERIISKTFCPQVLEETIGSIPCNTSNYSKQQIKLYSGSIKNHQDHFLYTYRSIWLKNTLDEIKVGSFMVQSIPYSNVRSWIHKKNTETKWLFLIMELTK